MRTDTERRCWLCGRNGSGDPLDRHHIFGGPYRKASERWGLTVDLCHDRCHENGPEAVHRCRETRELLCAWGQEKVMRERGWTVEQFRAVFGRSWVEPSVTSVRTGDSSLYRKGALQGAVEFRVLDAELPY